MKKTLIVVLVLLFVLSIAGTAFAGDDSFSNVPKDHWSYDAIKSLVRSGIVTGYNDHTFQADRSLTRYEMAVIIGKAKDNIDHGSVATKQLIEKLSKEYNKELKALRIRGTKPEGTVSKTNSNKSDNAIDWNGTNFRARYDHMALQAKGQFKTQSIINQLNNTSGNGSTAVPDYFTFNTELVATSRVRGGWNVQGRLVGTKNLNGINVVNNDHTNGALEVKDYKAFGDVDGAILSAGRIQSKIINGLVFDDFITGFTYSFGTTLKGTFYNGKVDSTQNNTNTIATFINQYDGINIMALSLSYPISAKTDTFATFYRTRSFNAGYRAANIWETAFNTKLSSVTTLQSDYASSNLRDNNTAYMIGLSYKEAKKEVPHSSGWKVDYVKIGAKSIISTGSDFKNTQVDITTDAKHLVYGDILWNKNTSVQTLNSTNGQKGYEVTYQYVPARDWLFTARYLEATPINGNTYSKIKWLRTEIQFFY